MKRSLKIFLVLIGLIIVGLPLALFVFFVRNEAPVLYGEIQAHIPFKGDLTLDIYHPTQGVYEQSPVQ